MTAPQDLSSQDKPAGHAMDDHSTQLAARQMIQATRHLIGCLCVVTVVIGVLLAVAEFSNTGTPFLAIVMLCGMLGGLVSVHSRMGSLPAARLHALSTSRTFAWMTCLVGGVLALAMYTMLMAGAIRGDAFPAFADHPGRHPTWLFAILAQFQERDAVHALLAYGPSTAVDAAKAAIWCFAAGFSEGLVNRFLSKMWG